MLSFLADVENPLSKYEALVYLCGSLKFLSENKVSSTHSS